MYVVPYIVPYNQVLVFFQTNSPPATLDSRSDLLEQIKAGGNILKPVDPSTKTNQIPNKLETVDDVMDAVRKMRQKAFLGDSDDDEGSDDEYYDSDEW